MVQSMCISQSYICICWYILLIHGKPCGPRQGQFPCVGSDLKSYKRNKDRRKRKENIPVGFLQPTCQPYMLHNEHVWICLGEVGSGGYIPVWGGDDDVQCIMGNGQIRISCGQTDTHDWKITFSQLRSLAGSKNLNWVKEEIPRSHQMEHQPKHLRFSDTTQNKGGSRISCKGALIQTRIANPEYFWIFGKKDETEEYLRLGLPLRSESATLI